jgi:hypothetical protein
MIFLCRETKELRSQIHTLREDAAYIRQDFSDSAARHEAEKSDLNAKLEEIRRELALRDEAHTATEGSVAKVCCLQEIPKM